MFIKAKCGKACEVIVRKEKIFLCPIGFYIRRLTEG
jgi:hypothetical protein